MRSIQRPRRSEPFYRRLRSRERRSRAIAPTAKSDRPAGSGTDWIVTDSPPRLSPRTASGTPNSKVFAVGNVADSLA